jgi:hypothetical protein
MATCPAIRFVKTDLGKCADPQNHEVEGGAGRAMVVVRKRLDADAKLAGLALSTYASVNYLMPSPVRADDCRRRPLVDGPLNSDQPVTLTCCPA